MPWSIKSENMKVGKAKFWYLAPFCAFDTMIMEIDESVFPLAIPHIEEEFGISASQAQWLFTTFMLGIASASIPASQLAGQFGFVHTGYFCLAVALVLYTATYFVNDFYGLAAIRFLIGCNASGLHNIRNNILSVYPRAEDRIYNITAVKTLESTLSVICPLLGSWLMELFSWRILLILPVIFVVITFFLLLMIENVKTPINNFKFDYLGTITMVLLVVSFNVSFTVVVDEQWLIFGICIAVFVLSCIGFYYSEKHASSGVCPLFIIKRPMIEIVSLNVFNNMSMYTNNFVLPQLMTYYKFDDFSEGLVTAIGSTFGVLSTGLQNIAFRWVTYRTVYPMFYLIHLIIQGLFIATIQFKYGGVVTYTMLVFTVLLTAEASYAEIMVANPPCLSASVCGIPGWSGKIGGTLGFTFTSSVFDITQNIVNANEDNPSSRLYGCVAAMASQMVIVLFCIWISTCRLGNGKYEKDKLLYDKKHDLDLEIPEYILDVEINRKETEDKEISEGEADGLLDNAE